MGKHGHRHALEQPAHRPASFPLYRFGLIFLSWVTAAGVPLVSARQGIGHIPDCGKSLRRISPETGPTYGDWPAQFMAKVELTEPTAGVPSRGFQAPREGCQRMPPKKNRDASKKGLDVGWSSGIIHLANRFGNQ